MSATARNAPCPCGSGRKYKKCCGRASAERRRAAALKPTYRPGCELDPRWWERLAATRPAESLPAPDEDPRVVGAELGLLRPPRSRRAPHDADYAALAAALREEAAARAHVRLGADYGGRLALLFRFAFDEELNAAVRQLPGRRFDWDSREWLVPCASDAAGEVATLLARFPHVVAAPAVRDWLAEWTRWHGLAAVWDAGDGLELGVLSRGGTAPAPLLGRARGERGGWLLLPLDRDTARLACEVDGLELDPVAAAAVRSVLDGHPPAGGELRLGADEEGEPQFELRVGTRLAIANDFVRLPAARFAGWRDGRFALDHQARLLAVPADPALVEALLGFLERNPDVAIGPETRAAIDAHAAEHRRAQATIALSLAHDAPLEVARVDGDLHPFQRAGVRYALEQRRTFVADEQGLGKTVQALAAVEADGAYPAAVVCPASLKLNWAREAERWVPHRSVAVVGGRSPAGWERAGADRAEIVIVNYDIVDSHVDALARRGLRAAVFDESHYCKEPRAKRTKASIELSRQVSADGLRLALTGTPILNRPKELTSQLRLLDRLADFGSGAGMARRFRGDGALERLHWHLRAHCYVRRLKADVLPQLPAKHQSIVPVDLSNEREYRLAERNVIVWLKAQPLKLRTLEAKVAAARRAERLVQLNKLRELAGRGKLAAALGWLDDFLASGEPLVVFADHVELQRAVLDRLPGAVHVLGDDSAAQRDAAVAAFQRPDGPQAIVCSLRAGGQGLTLTRASNVAFLELDWTPARLAQAEDRCHRIGQASAVTAWYLLAPDTIDETMSRLIEHKRGVIGAITDGQVAETHSLVDAVAAELRGRAVEAAAA